MITTIYILILIFSILKRPVDGLLNKLKGVDWKNLTGDIGDKIIIYSKKGARSATGPILTFYYVLQEGNLTTLEVAMLYAGIIYIAFPSDLLPRAVLGWEGLMDARTGKVLTPAKYRNLEMVSKDLIKAELDYGDEGIIMDRRGNNIVKQ